MFVRDYMTPNPLSISPNTTYPEAIGLMREKKIRRLPVMRKGKLVGIVVEKDLLSSQPSPATTLSIHEMYGLLEKLKVEQFMTTPVVTATPNCPMEAAAEIMIDRKIGSLPVMDDEKLVGIITETDIFKAFVSVLGGFVEGVRLTIELPDRPGQLAKIAEDIAKAKGNILAVTTTNINEDATSEVTIKETGADVEALKKRLEEREISIVDLRSHIDYSPREYGK
jgi:acetoin utilization protein AcuB